MRRFGNDKPSLRFGLEHTDITDVVIEQLGGGVPFFAETAERLANGTLRRDVPAEIVKVMRVPTESSIGSSNVLQFREVMEHSAGSAGVSPALDVAARQAPSSHSAGSAGILPALDVALRIPKSSIGMPAGSTLLTSAVHQRGREIIVEISENASKTSSKRGEATRAGETFALPAGLDKMCDPRIRQTPPPQHKHQVQD